MIERQIKCIKCGCEEMHIIFRSSCGICCHNGILINEDNYAKLADINHFVEKDKYAYFYDLPEGYTRNQVELSRSCELGGPCYGDGCWVISCSECGIIDSNINYCDEDKRIYE